MKKILGIILVCTAVAGVLRAAEGDTTRISSHQETHWSWYGDYYDTVQFPQSGSYRRILMYYTMGCPSIGCSEWDYTTKIEVSDVVGDTTHWIELVRIMTPYAGNKTSSWKHTWIIDVTDYAPFLTGERSIKAQYQGYQDGFTISVNFDFIEGIPPRNVLKMDQLYHGAFRYGFADDPIEDHLVPLSMTMDPDLESARFRMVASGHSFGGNQDCAEFCKKYYRLYIDNTQVVQQSVWRDDCGSNPLEGQTGTWIYQRSGWCPGAETVRYDTEIGSFVDAGQSNVFNVDWEGYTYTGGAGFDPQYLIEAQIFQYAGWNHNLDLAIDNVLQPSLNDRVMDINPVCNNPQIVITNTGAEFITKASFEYWTEGAPEHISSSWTGPLSPGESKTIDLASADWKLFGGKTSNVFYVKITSVNGEEDDYEANNLFKSKFNETMMMPEAFIVAFSNNGAANEVSYSVVDDVGNAVFTRTQAAAFAAYMDTLTLEPGCYTLMIQDSDCDGLSFFANGDGNGKIWLHNADQATFYPPIYKVNPEFGCESQLAFTVGYTLGNDGLVSPAGPRLKVYPNPSQGDITLALENGFVPGELTVFDQRGRMVHHSRLQRVNGTVIAALPAGVYTAHFRNSTVAETARFVIVR